VNTLQLADISENLSKLQDTETDVALKPIVDKALSGETLSNEEYGILAQNILIYLYRERVPKEDAIKLIEKWNIQNKKPVAKPQGNYPRQVM